MNSAQGDLAPLFQFANASTRNLLEHRLKSKVEERQSSTGQRRRDEGSGDAVAAADILRSPLDNGEDRFMNSYLVYRASFYLMLVVASLALIGDSTEGQFARLYPRGRDDRRDRRVLHGRPAPAVGPAAASSQLLAVATLGLLYVEYKVDETQMIQALGHWLVYLQLVKYFLPKTAEDDWFLFLLGLMQVLIGSVINQSDQVGTWLFLWAMLAVWVLGQFFLQREAHRLLPVENFDGGMRIGQSPLDRPVPRACSTFLTCWRQCAFWRRPLRWADSSFWCCRGRPGRPASQAAAPMARHLTGFDEEVQLGQLGEILENDSVVMSIELTDEDDKAIRPAEEPLWRGVTMLRYEKGRWHRQSRPTQSVVSFPKATVDARARRRSTRRSLSSPTTPQPCSASGRCSTRGRPIASSRT